MFTFLLALAGMGMQLAAARQQSAYAAAQAKMDQQIAQRNQMIAEQNAAMREKLATIEQVRALKAGQKRSARMKAKLGASGVMLDEGAPANALADQAVENAWDVANVGWEGRQEAGRYRQQAANFGYEAQAAKLRKANARTAGRIGMANTVLSGFGSMGQAGMFESTPFGKLWG